MEYYRQYRAFTPTVPVQEKHPVSVGTTTARYSRETIADNPSPPPTPFPQPSSSVLPLIQMPSTHPSEPVYVAFEPSDPRNPQNWSMAYKAWNVFLLAFLTLSLTFASSASSSAEQGVMEEFGCGEVAATAMTGLFLIGMGVGAMPFASLSELYGRFPVYTITIFFATLFELGSALSNNITSLLILRFIAGVASTAPLSNAGGTLNDIGNPVVRTWALPFYTTCGFVAPILAPLIGGYLATNPNLGWRWCYHLCAIWNALAFVMVGLFMPETLGSALLRMKAIRLRRETGDGKWRSKVEDESLVEATKRALKRPFIMLVREPAVQLFVAYLTVVYIVLYGSFSAYPIIFSAHGLDQRHTGLTFIPVMLGFFVLLGITFFHYLRYRKLVADAAAGKQRRGIWQGKVEPEERLVPLMVGAIFFPAGLFWLAWTSAPKYSVYLTAMSGIPFGVGLLAIFQGCMQYMIDAYGPYASSALSGSTLMRYGVSGAVILGFPRMYENLGPQWATSLFGFLGLALTPVPFVFYIYGRRVRARCHFTVRD